MRENVILISHLREILGFACRQVARTSEPLIVQRYDRQDVVIVPLADWRFFQQMEAELDGQERGDAATEEVLESFPDSLDVLGPSR